MTRFPTAAVREQAAQLCSAMAFVRATDQTLKASIRDVMLELDLDADHAAIAWKAFDAAGEWQPTLWFAELWVLACSMLRNFEVP